MTADRTTPGCDHPPTPTPRDELVDLELRSSHVGVRLSKMNTMASATALPYTNDPTLTSIVNSLRENERSEIHADSISPARDSTSLRNRRSKSRKKKRKTVDRATETHEGERDVVASNAKENLMLLLVGNNYVVSGSYGLKSSAMTPSLVYIDTCSGVNVIREGALPPSWVQYREPLTFDPGLGDANRNPIHFVGVIRLSIRFANRVYRVPFLVAKTFAVDVLVGTSFHNKYIKLIACIEQQITFSHEDTIPILEQNHSALGSDASVEEGAPVHPSNSKTGSSRQKGKRHPKDANTIRMVKGSTIPPQSQIALRVRCDGAGLSYLTPKMSLLFRHNVRLANGIAEIHPKREFEVVVANFGKKAVRLPKHTVLGYATRHPLAILTPSAEFAKPFASILNLSPLPNNDVSSTPSSGEEKSTTDWKKEVDLSHIGDETLKSRIFKMLSKHEKMWDGSLGTIKVTEHRIELEPGTKPIRSLPYRQGPATRRMTAEQIQEQLDAGVIEPCTTEWASPIVFAPKKDGTLRFCVDYRKLNTKTLSDAYPLPRTDDCIDSLGDAAVFSTLDCNSGYWQIPMSVEDMDKTAFVSHLGTYRYKRMPFGLKNAPATFQRALDIILSGLRWQVCLIYLDDVIVFSKDMEQHLDHLDQVLSLLRDAGVSLKLRKCSFFQSRVTYLGHVISPGKLSIADENRDAISEALFPQNITQLRSFLGLCNVFRRFVQGFSKIARPLNEMLKKDASPDYENPTEDQLKAFQDLKTVLLNPPVLALPKADKPYVIETDASAYQVGCALLQEQDTGNYHPVGFWSRTLTQAERNYSATERECLAVVWSVTSLRPYIEGTKFTVRTDHDCLRWLMNLTESSGRLTRWRLRLAEFDFVIEYKPGRKNQVADALSRMIRPRGPEEPIDDMVPCFVSPKHTVLAITTRSRKKVKASKPKSKKKPQKRVTQEDDDVGYEIIHDDMDDPDELDMMDPDEQDHLRAARYDAEMLADAKEFSVDDLPSPLTFEEILQEQKNDSYCQTILARVSTKKKNPFFEGDDGLLRRKCPYDGQVQIVLPESLRPRVLNLSHHALLAGHPGQTRLYNTVRRTYYWPHMAADTYATVRNCGRCAKNRIKLRRRTNYLKLFPAREPLESLAMDILGPLTKTKSGCEYLLVICCRFTKLTQVVPLRSVTAYNLAVAFCSHLGFQIRTTEVPPVRQCTVLHGEVFPGRLPSSRHRK